MSSSEWLCGTFTQPPEARAAKKKTDQLLPIIYVFLKPHHVAKVMELVSSAK